MHVVGNILICGLTNICGQVQVAQGVNVITGEELWQFRSEDPSFGTDIQDRYCMVPNEDVVLICGVGSETSKGEDQEVYQLGFFSYHPELFDKVNDEEKEGD